MSSDTALARIEAKLDTLVRLLALNVLTTKHSLKDRAVALQRAGLTPKDIAVLCESTPNAVSVALSAVKRQGKSRKKAKA